MSNVVTLNTETRVDGHGSFSMSAYVGLNDNDQILIDVPVVESNWNNGKWEARQIGTKKARLEVLNYSNHTADKSMELVSLTVRGFCKDGSLRVRSEHVYSDRLTKEVLDQIPDSYHEHARDFFRRETERLQKELSAIIAKGVVVQPRTLP